MNVENRVSKLSLNKLNGVRINNINNYGIDALKGKKNELKNRLKRKIEQIVEMEIRMLADANQNKNITFHRKLEYIIRTYLPDKSRNLLERVKNARKSIRSRRKK